MLNSYQLHNSHKLPSEPLPTAEKLKYHYSKDFLRIYESHQFAILVEYIEDQNESENFKYMFPKMINVNPNKIMNVLWICSRTHLISNKDFLVSLRETLQYIQKDLVYPYLLCELNDRIKNVLEKMDPEKKNTKKLRQCYEHLQRLGGEDFSEKIRNYNTKLRALKGMR